MNDLKFTTAEDYMNTDTKFDDLMYHAGLTAQGCLDKMDDYDRKAIQKFAELIVIKCAEVADTAEPFLSSDLIKGHFGVE